jgi:transcriptional regulator GlxA family with amidase domain
MRNGHRSSMPPMARSDHPAAPRRVLVLVIPPIEELDLAGPVQVLGTANRLTGGAPAPYDVRVATTSRERVIAGENGLSMLAQSHYREVRGEIDSLLLVVGVSSRNACTADLAAWLRDVVPRCRRVGAVCVAAFVLAKAGVLTNQRATVHWKYAHELARCYPRLGVDPSALWVRAGHIYTSSGFSAGIDLALAWVEEVCGSRTALEAARELVLFLRRPAAQTQLSVTLAAQAAEMRPIQELQVWIAENLRRDLSVPVLAERVAMSVRHFVRVFTADVGTTPARYVRHLRVEAAKRLLESSSRGLEQIAAAVGFGNADVMRRAFVRVAGVSHAAVLSRD